MGRISGFGVCLTSVASMTGTLVYKLGKCGVKVNVSHK